MNEDRAQLLERLQQANNVLITVNSNPTVDQLAACIGFTILLNKLSKHATAVFSGSIPSTLEFLKPEETLEKNTDSLRDFIIALDKSKADKLRYKVEDTMVKIFITPYKTSISDADLEFSQGDFNVDVVLALGVHEREQVDKVIMAHGRILHDAVVMTADTKAGNNIGTINWVNEQASSLCEMLASIVEELKPQSLDAQIATALLTGIVAETERFRNQKTSSSTMEVSSKLMAAGADQQLVASKLEPEVVIPKTNQPQPEAPVPADESDGAMVIDHTDESQNDQELPPVDFGDDESLNQIRIDDHGTLKKKSEWLTDKKDSQPTDGKYLTNDKSQTSKMVFEPPTMGGTLTANSKPEQFDPSTDPLSVTNGDEALLARTSESSSSNSGSGIPTKLSDVISQSTSLKTAIGDNQTLEEIEEVVKDQEAASVTSQPTIEDIENARGAVNDANLGSDSPKPIAGLNAQPIDLDLGHGEANNNANSSTDSLQTPTNTDSAQTDQSAQDTSTDVSSTDVPPPVPPPMMPPFNSPSTTSPQ